MLSLQDVLNISGCKCTTKEVDLSRTFRGVAPIESASSEEISFISTPTYNKFLATTNAGVVITSQKESNGKFIHLYHENPNLAYALLSQKFNPRRQYKEYRHPSAVIAESVSIGSDVHIMANVVIGEGSKIGSQTVIFPNTYIGRNVVIGERNEVRQLPLIVVRWVRQGLESTQS